MNERRKQKSIGCFKWKNKSTKVQEKTTRFFLPLNMHKRRQVHEKTKGANVQFMSKQ